MWRTMHKLNKTFADLVGPSRVATSFESKIDKFKHHLPVLTTICNPGLKEYHWDQVGVIRLSPYYKI